MEPQELREKFIKFFEDKGHKLLPSSSLIPQDDPSVLLTTAGMQQFKKWYTRIEEPAYDKAVTVQKCVRIDDIEEVGDKTHLSFFEMLGNFSFGDYFKKEAIEYALEFVTKELGIKPDNLYFTYFEGNKETPKDDESLKVLKDINIPEDKVVSFGKEDNFWGPTGSEGPCGPTVEVFVGDPREDGVEIWNLVFNEYYRHQDGKYTKLEHSGVDTGAGFERILMILNKKDSPYDTELFTNIVSKIKELAKSEADKAEKIIADHLRTATFLLADGVVPSNLDKGYVARRLIRRAIRFGRVLGIEGVFVSQIVEVVINDYKAQYSELEQNRAKILDELNKEEEKFSKTIENGLKEYKNNLNSWRNYFKESIREFYGGVFRMYETHGFPREMTLELLQEDMPEMRSKENIEDFWNHTNELFQKHQEASRKGAEKKFKGGLETGGEQETKFHTATHLMYRALQIVLGDHVKQAGANITSDRIRFDFTHPEKMTPEQIEEVEKLVNDQIKASLPVILEEMPLDRARKEGASGIFDSKYGDKVRVYTIGDFSKEICGGPHVKNTSELGVFKIKKEESSSSGVRRIKAILE